MNSLSKLDAQTPVKILYHGTGVSGRTTNLLYLHSQIHACARSQLCSISRAEGRRISFEMSLPCLQTNVTRSIDVQLYCGPGAIYYPKSRHADLVEADAVVFVVDSQADRFIANEAALREIVQTLSGRGEDLSGFPWVIQYNKQDLPLCTPLAELQQAFNVVNVPYFKAIATQGVGVFETLDACIRAMFPLRDLDVIIPRVG